MDKNRFSVWVGGIEVNDVLLSEEEANKLADQWRAKGYDDVCVDDYSK